MLAPALLSAMLLLLLLTPAVRAERLAAICPDGSALLVYRVSQVPCAGAKLVSPADVPALGPGAYERLEHGLLSVPRAPDEAATITLRSAGLRRVLIDPGHGGRDPGARGPDGLREKDLVLEIAFALADRLEQEGVDVALTREDDSSLFLADRLDRVRDSRADLVVSIHANASRHRDANGVETYVLETQQRHPVEETGSATGSDSDSDGDRASRDADLARAVHGALVGELQRVHGDTRDLGVKHQVFRVLEESDVPAVLIEVGFLTHADEARRLAARSFPKRAAAGIARGILAYGEAVERVLVAER